MTLRPLLARCFWSVLRTVQRWVTLWENSGEEALQDGRSAKEASDLDPSILLSCPDFVFELRSWIKEKIAKGGKNEEGYLTVHQIQQYINDKPAFKG